MLIGVTGSLGSALMTVNLPVVQGALGLDPAEGAWFGAAYVMGGIAMNLLLIKYRQQFGLSSFVKAFLGLYAIAALAQVVITETEGVLVVRVISGIAGAAMTTFTVFYMLQAFSARYRLTALGLGISLTQTGLPLARLISPTLLDLGDWTLVYVFEAGLVLACLASVTFMPLPHGVRYHVFEKKDVVSFALLASAFALLSGVMAQGRIQWWVEAPWIGWAAAAAVALLVAGLVFEHRRENPLVDTRWIFSRKFLRFTFSIFLVRILLSEQTYGGIGLLQVIGIGSDQMQLLHGVILLAVIAGVLTSGALLAISPRFIPLMELLAPALIAVAAFMDSQSTLLTHPVSLFLSQSMMGFAGAMFMAAAFLLGFLLLFARGIGSFVTFIVTFSVAQMLGGLAGPALFGTLQIIRTNHHSAYLVGQLTGSDPQVAEAIRGALFDALIGSTAKTLVETLEGDLLIVHYRPKE